MARFYTGVSVDGIYRVSGNMADIQKLRLQVDSGSVLNLNWYLKKCSGLLNLLSQCAGATYDLNSSQWEVHVLTGALKMFFRELREPLIPFVFYDKFLAALSESTTLARTYTILLQT